MANVPSAVDRPVPGPVVPGGGAPGQLGQLLGLGPAITAMAIRRPGTMVGPTPRPIRALHSRLGIQLGVGRSAKGTWMEAVADAVRLGAATMATMPYDESDFWSWGSEEAFRRPLHRPQERCRWLPGRRHHREVGRPHRLRDSSDLRQRRATSTPSATTVLSSRVRGAATT